MLSDHRFPPQLEKDRGDVVRDFYLPCMQEATRYDRLTGYFSSAVFTIVWTGLKDFVKRQGNIRLVCSPALAEQDVDGLVSGYAARDDEELARQLKSELATLLEDERVRDTARALAALIVAGRINVRIAEREDAPRASTKRMFHDKVGLFADDAGNAVCFRGSMNETFLGLSTMGHTDSIDINPSWEGGRDAQRVQAATSRFEDIWHDQEPGLRIRQLPDVTMQELKDAAGDADWEVLVDAAVAATTAAEEQVDYDDAVPRVAGFPLRDHQVKAWEAWEANGRRGILKHATGAGKTFTGIWAIKVALDDGLVPVVLVPKRLLLRQWYADIREALPDARVLRCGDGHSEWKDRGYLRAWLTAGGSTPRIFIAVLATAASEEFLRELRPRTDLLMIADEVHAVGSPTNRRILEIDADARLGLSATPERYGDPEGTAALFDYFGPVVDTYELRDAINDRVLTPYRYTPHLVALTDPEQEEWEDLTRQIRQRVARLQSNDDGGWQEDERLKQLLIKRARVAKKAVGKASRAERIITDNYDDGHRWLVYCEDQEQLRDVRQRLDNAGLPTLEYHTAMTGHDEATMRQFEVLGGVLVSINCLDEGVDIPAATHAVILASSKNPRQFIQRRGRVLRKSKHKNIAHLHDTIVVPGTASDDELADRLILGELARAREFAGWAVNSATATRPLEEYCLEHGLDVELLWQTGEEDPVDE